MGQCHERSAHQIQYIHWDFVCPTVTDRVKPKVNDVHTNLNSYIDADEDAKLDHFNTKIALSSLLNIINDLICDGSMNRFDRDEF